MCIKLTVKPVRGIPKNWFTVSQGPGWNMSPKLVPFPRDGGRIWRNDGTPAAGAVEGRDGTNRGAATCNPTSGGCGCSMGMIAWHGAGEIGD